MVYVNLSLQRMIRIALFFLTVDFFKVYSIGISPDYISVINVSMYEEMI